MADVRVRYTEILFTLSIIISNLHVYDSAIGLPVIDIQSNNNFDLKYFILFIDDLRFKHAKYALLYH